jgi:hypothetical protein
MISFNKIMAQAKKQLEAGENIVAAVYGRYETDFPRNAVFLATDRRLIFYAEKMLGYSIEVFPYSNISSLEMSKGLIGHTITFFASGNHAKLKWITQGDVPHFVNYVKSRMDKKTTEQPQETVDIAEQIRKLAELRDKGIVTEEEFQSKKTEMLSRL